MLSQKLEAASMAKLTGIFCVGETLQQRQEGRTLQVIENQLLQGLKRVMPDHWPLVMIAYEPVWAIGTGLTAGPDQVSEVHAHIFSILQKLTKQDVPILYGGSVNTKNFLTLLNIPHVDGGLVGGASLQAGSYHELLAAASQT